MINDTYFSCMSKSKTDILFNELIIINVLNKSSDKSILTDKSESKLGYADPVI